MCIIYTKKIYHYYSQNEYLDAFVFGANLNAHLINN